MVSPHHLPSGRIQKVRHPLMTPALFFLGVGMIVGGLWIVSTSGLVANHLKPRLEVELAQALNRTVAIGRLEGLLFNRLILKNVTISSPAKDSETLDITIDRVVVQYSLWDILVRKRSPADSLHQIQLIRPLIQFERSPEGEWKGPDLMSLPRRRYTAGPGIPPPVVPAIKISLVAGEIRLTDASHTASIRKLRGLLNLKDPSAVRLFLSGRTDRHRLQNIKISGILDLNQQDYRLSLKASRVGLRPFERVAKVTDYFEIMRGHADLELKVRSGKARSRVLIPGVRVDGKLVLYDVTGKTSLLARPLQNIFGVVHLADNQLIIKNVQAIFGKTTWSGQGSVENLEKPRLNIKVQSENLDLADLIESFPRLSQLPASGSGEAVISIKGQAPDLAVTGTFKIPQGKIGNLKIRKFETISRFKNNELRLLKARGIFARGWIEGSGRILFPETGPEPGRMDFQGSVQNLAAEEIASLFGLKDIQGRLDGILDLKGRLDQPILKGSLSASRIKIAKMNFRKVKGRLEYRRNVLDLDLKSDWENMTAVRLRVQGEHQAPGWALKKLRITQGRRELLSAEGDWSIARAGVFAGRVRTSDLPIKNIAFLPDAVSHLQGTLNFKGRLDGAFDRPALAGRFHTKSMLNVKGNKIDAQGEISLTPQKIELQKVHLDRKRIRLSGWIDLKKPVKLQGTLIMQKVDLENLAALGGMRSGQSRLSGQASGRVSLTGALKALKSKGTVTLAGLKWAGLSADSGSLEFSSSGRRLWIKKLEMLQRGGKFNAVLETDRKKNDRFFHILAWMESFEIGKKKWTGDLKIDGACDHNSPEPEYSGKLALDHLEVDGKALPSAEGELVLAGKKINLKRLQWGQSLSGSGEFSFGSELGGVFQLMLEKSDLDAVRALIVPGKEALGEPLSGSVQMILNRRQLNGKAHLNARQSEIRCEFNTLFSQTGKLGAYSGHIEMRDMRSATVFDLALLTEPENAPQGTLSGWVDFQGRAGRLKALSGDVDFLNFKLGHWHFKQLKTAWEANDKAVKILKLEGRQPLGSLQVSAGAMHFMPDGQHALNLDLKAENFHFFLKRIHGEFKLKGTLGLKPVHDLQLEIASPDFGLEKYVFGDFRAGVRYRGENLEIRTPPDCPFPIVGDLSLPPGGAVIFKRLTIADARHNYECINAAGRIDDEGTSDFLVKAHDVPADMIARCLGWPQPWTGIANGSVHYTDSQHIPHIRIKPKIENGSVIGLPFDVFYGDLVLDRDWLHFRGPEGAAVLRRYGKYTMFLTGKIPVPQDDAAAERMKGMEMDVSLSMPEGDLAYLVFVPHIASAGGKSSLELKLRGTMEYPSLSGRAGIVNGTIAPRLYAPEIKNIYADLKFEDNKMFIQRLEGRLGEGILKVTAGSSAPWACIFRRLQPHQLNLILDSGEEHLSLDATSEYEFVSADVKMRAWLRGTLEEPVIGGSMELANGQFTYPPRALTEYARQIDGAATRYDKLKIISRRNFWFYNDVVRAQIAPDNSVVLNGGKHDFSGEGQVEITKGSFSYLDTDFNLDPNEKTRVVLQGREKPRLQGLAKTVIRDVQIRDEGRRRDATIYLKVRGEIGALTAEFKSDPEMTKGQIVSLLTLGEDFSSWSGEEVDRKIRSGGAGLKDIPPVLGRWAGKLLGRQIEKEIKKIAPLDVIDIRLGGVQKLTDSIMEGDSNTGPAAAEGGTEVTGTSLLMNTQIDVGKYLTDDLFLNYRGILKESEGEPGSLSWQSLVGLEYHLDTSRKIKIYKNFDVDSGQELFLGIEGRTEFKSWSPEEEKEGRNDIAARMTPTPGKPD